MTVSPLEFAQNRPNAYLSELREFLTIPSISTRPEHDKDVRNAAQWLGENMGQAGLQNIRIFPTMGHPIVYADWLHAEGKPTVLFYGHYDVQPADDLDLWQTPPFEPDIRNDSIYARGASDDKGQTLILLKAVEAYLQTHGTLPVNVKFIIEGEEESGGEAIAKFLPENQELLSADIAFVSDTAMADFNKPAIVYGLRGIAAINLDITGPRLDLHSGSYGGAINNPIHVLTNILAQLKTPAGQVLVPGFYDNVRELSAKEKQLLASNDIDESAWVQWTGAPTLWGETDFSLAERLGARPTLEINGIHGGYTGDGAKTIIPSKAHAKITMRLVPDQNPQKILENIQKYIASLTPESVHLQMHPLGTSPASVCDLEHPAIQSAAKACEQIWDTAPIFKREGGSIPVVGQFKRDLGLETILLGFGLPHDRIHAPNERFHLPNFYNGIQAVIKFLEIYGNV